MTDQFDGYAALSAMGKYGLDPDNDADADMYLEAFKADLNRNDPRAGDRYDRAAQAAASRKQGAEIIQKGKELGRTGNFELADLWQASQAKAQPVQQHEPEPISVLDDMSGAGAAEVLFGGAEQDPGDQVTAQAWRMMMEAGVDIFEDDPEIDLVKSDGTEDEFLQSIQQAIAKKAARLAWQDGKKPDMDALWKGASNKIFNTGGKS